MTMLFMSEISQSNEIECSLSEHIFDTDSDVYMPIIKTLEHTVTMDKSKYGNKITVHYYAPWICR